MSLTYAEEDPMTPNSQGYALALQASKMRDVFPDLSDAELNRVGEALNAYYVVILRVYERLRQEKPEIIDEFMKNRKMEGNVDSSKY